MIFKQKYNQNALQKTRQDASLFKFFLSQKGIVIQEPEEFSPEELKLHLKEIIVGVRKNWDGTTFEPSSLRSIVASTLV